jgi:hypothetical protein
MPNANETAKYPKQMGMPSLSPLEKYCFLVMMTFSFFTAAPKCGKICKIQPFPKEKHRKRCVKYEKRRFSPP